MLFPFYLSLKGKVKLLKTHTHLGHFFHRLKWCLWVRIPGRCYRLRTAGAPYSYTWHLEELEPVWGEDEQHHLHCLERVRMAGWWAGSGVTLCPSPFLLSFLYALLHSPHFLFWKRKWWHPGVNGMTSQHNVIAASWSLLDPGHFLPDPTGSAFPGCFHGSESEIERSSVSVRCSLHWTWVTLGDKTQLVL